MIANEYVNRAIDYIQSRIGENLTVDEIAAHCNFSRFHFSRMFKAETGESLGSLVRHLNQNALLNS